MMSMSMTRTMSALAALEVDFTVDFNLHPDGVLILVHDEKMIYIEPADSGHDVVDAFQYWVDGQSDPYYQDIDLTPVRALRFIFDQFDW